MAACPILVHAAEPGLHRLHIHFGERNLARSFRCSGRARKFRSCSITLWALMSCSLRDRTYRLSKSFCFSMRALQVLHLHAFALTLLLHGDWAGKQGSSQSQSGGSGSMTKDPSQLTGGALKRHAPPGATLLLQRSCTPPVCTRDSIRGQTILWRSWEENT